MSTYAISGTTETLSEELTAYCNKYGYEQGFVTDARYTILADDNGHGVCLGDEFSLERANEIIHRLSFKAGFCRSWEISAAHLEETASPTWSTSGGGKSWKRWPERRSGC